MPTMPDHEVAAVQDPSAKLQAWVVRLAPHHSSFRPIVSPKGSRAWLFIDGSLEPARCDAAFGLTCCS
jgi:hypothetical protein